MVLLDLEMPVMKGTEALDFILAQDPDAYVIMLTSVKDPAVIYERLMAGAQYYLPKHDPTEKIRPTLQEQIEMIKSKAKR